MKTALKKKWIAALRSGKYAQGDGELCADHGTPNAMYCCLGVLAEVGDCRLKHWDRGFLPDRVAKQLGMPIITEDEQSYYSSSERLRPSDPLQAKLAKLNDRGWGFKRIATWIEKNL